MRIKSVKSNSSKWFDLNPSVDILTDDGVVSCSRFYFNGFQDCSTLLFSDKNKYTFTKNHKLHINGDWKCVVDITAGDYSNNGLEVIDVSEAGIHATMDMEVPRKHYYILSNGIKSHNTSFLMGQVSSGIEPIKSNYHEQTLAKIQAEYKNPELIKVLDSYGKNTKAIWAKILKDNGSVQGLDFLSQHEKDVFKTFSEVSQMDLIKLAAQRQKYIDMGQSLNLMFHPDTSAKDLNKITLAAYDEGIKSLYYQYTISAAQQFNKSLLECTSCEG